MQIRAIIVEDEKNNRENLNKILLEYCKNVQVVAICNSALEGRKAIAELQPDLHRARTGSELLPPCYPRRLIISPGFPFPRAGVPRSQQGN